MTLQFTKEPAVCECRHSANRHYLDEEGELGPCSLCRCPRYAAREDHYRNPGKG